VALQAAQLAVTPTTQQLFRQVLLLHRLSEVHTAPGLLIANSHRPPTSKYPKMSHAAHAPTASHAVQWVTPGLQHRVWHCPLAHAVLPYAKQDVPGARDPGAGTHVSPNGVTEYPAEHPVQDPVALHVVHRLPAAGPQQ
jgi:hypothetical protein